MSTPTRTEAVEALAGLRRAERNVGPKKARVYHNHNEPKHKMGNLPPENEYGVGPDLGETVVLADPRSAATGREAFRAAWEAYENKHLAHRPYPKAIDPRKGASRGKRTERRTRRPSIGNANLYRAPSEGNNMRKHRGGRRRRTYRRRRV